MSLQGLERQEQLNKVLIERNNAEPVGPQNMPPQRGQKLEEPLVGLDTMGTRTVLVI